MEIRNHTTNMVMHPRLNLALEMVRRQRAFKVQEYVDQKIALLNSYYKQSGLSSAVIAVSGGIDSAVVLGLVARASLTPDSPIKRIVAVALPALENDGVTGQGEAWDLAREVCRSFGVELKVVVMDSIVKSITSRVDDILGGPPDSKAAWASGQAVSYARTPTYYYITSVLAAQGTPGLVIGTTNLSEGGFLGYFGKASDGMVDLQLISDLFKSEVYEVGRLLGVPQSILDREPTGDMFDATTDEVVFGAPYDFVEIYTHALWSPLCQYAIEDFIADYPEAVRQFSEYRENLERMRAYNSHKYLGRSPAVHLDIMDCHVIGGWDNPSWRPR